MTPFCARHCGDNVTCLARLAGIVMFCGIGAAPAALHATAKFKSLFTFSYSGDGNLPGPLVHTGGHLYGIASEGAGNGTGALFSFDPVRRKETVLVNFGRGNPGANPTNLNQYGEELFSSLQNGYIYQYHTGSGAGRVIYDWQNSPIGVESFDLTKVAGDLYGYAIIQGGGGIKATLFKLDLKTDQATALFTFLGGNEGGAPNGQLIYNKGKIYGAVAVYDNTQSGGIFRYDIATGKETMVDILDPAKDGAQAVGLVACGGVFYGAADEGGAHGYGTVFSFNPETGKKRTLYAFAGGTDSRNPETAPVCYRGELYGTTDGGGAQDYGTIYSVGMKTGRETVVHSFDGADGAYPEAAPVRDGDVMYGTTTEGPQNGGVGLTGTIFRLSP